MLIDGFTVLAQAINFLVLIVLLRHFLYRPLLRAVAGRERRIAAELAAARAAREQAQNESAQLAQRQAQIEAERERVLAMTLADAQAERRNVLEHARQDAERMQAEWHLAMQTEFSRLRATLVQRTCEEVYSLARRLLADLAGEQLQTLMVAKFVVRLQQGGAPELTLLGSQGTVNVGPYARLRHWMPQSRPHSNRRSARHFRHPVNSCSRPTRICCADWNWRQAVTDCHGTHRTIWPNSNSAWPCCPMRATCRLRRPHHE